MTGAGGELRSLSLTAEPFHTGKCCGEWGAIAFSCVPIDGLQWGVPIQ